MYTVHSYINLKIFLPSLSPILSACHTCGYWYIACALSERRERVRFFPFAALPFLPLLNFYDVDFSRRAVCVTTRPVSSLSVHLSSSHNKIGDCLRQRNSEREGSIGSGGRGPYKHFTPRPDQHIHANAVSVVYLVRSIHPAECYCCGHAYATIPGTHFRIATAAAAVVVGLCRNDAFSSSSSSERSSLSSPQTRRSLSLLPFQFARLLQCTLPTAASLHSSEIEKRGGGCSISSLSPRHGSIEGRYRETHPEKAEERVLKHRNLHSYPMSKFPPLR